MIKQIILDVLKSRKVDMIFDIYAKQIYPELNGEKMIKHNAEIYMNDIAKSISAKISAVSVDREELQNILMHYKYRSLDKFMPMNELVDKILSLLKPVEILGRGEVEINRQKDWVDVEGVFKLFLYENTVGFKITYVKKVSSKEYNITIGSENISKRGK